jgi:hypothetical protein
VLYIIPKEISIEKKIIFQCLFYKKCKEKAMNNNKLKRPRTKTNTNTKTKQKQNNKNKNKNNHTSLFISSSNRFASSMFAFFTAQSIKLLYNITLGAFPASFNFSL